MVANKKRIGSAKEKSKRRIEDEKETTLATAAGSGSATNGTDHPGSLTHDAAQLNRTATTSVLLAPRDGVGLSGSGAARPRSSLTPSARHRLPVRPRGADTDLRRRVRGSGPRSACREPS